MSVIAPQTELRKAIVALRPYFKRAGWFSLFSSLLVLAPSWYMLEVYDRVVNSRNIQTLVMLTLLVLFLYAIMELLEWARAEVMMEASAKLDERMRGRIFNAIFEANLKRVPGGTTQPMSDFKTVRDFIFSPALMAVMETPMSLVCLLLVFAISPVLGWFSVVAAVVQTMVGWINEKSTQPQLSAANRSAFGAQQYADGTLRNAQVIESMGMLRNVHARWVAKQREFLGLQASASSNAGGFQAISKFIQNIVSSFTLGLAAWLVLHNLLNGGSAYMMVASILAGRVLAPLVQVVAQWQSIVNVRDSFGRLEDMLEKVPAKAQGMPLPPPDGRLTVEPLIGGAPGSSSVILKGVTFSLNPGDVLAVVGPSASGKTSLARMLVGVWPATTGKVRLDGADVFAWNKADLGRHMGYLPQGVELFDGTIAENIARFGEVDPVKVAAAAKAVGLHEFIASLPQGYDHAVGREGAMLSGGQRQRVALARAIYDNPSFVVLDEPNSSLDDQGDAALAGAISQLKARGTTFVIMTHRASILGVTDKMLVLRDGQPQLFGPRDEVLKALNEAAAKASQLATQGVVH